MMHPADQPKCFANHMGVWLILPTYFNAVYPTIINGTWQRSAADRRSSAYRYHPRTGEREYDMQIVDGTAILPVYGVLMKTYGKFSDTGTVDVRRAIRQAEADPSVQRLLFHIESPGGSASGTDQLGHAIATCTKPTIAYIDDLAASAGYWVASQCDHIVASPLAEIGSIGCYMRVADTTGQYEREGIAVHLVTTGQYKGMGTDGTPITPDHIAHLQEGVDTICTAFTAAIAAGRRIPATTIAEWADGRMHFATDAITLGMIDAIDPHNDLETYLATLSTTTPPPTTHTRHRQSTTETPEKDTATHEVLRLFEPVQR